MTHDEKPKAYWEAKRDALADKYVFDTNGLRWGNNNDECGDNLGSFVSGFNACREEMQREIDELKKLNSESSERSYKAHISMADLMIEKSRLRVENTKLQSTLAKRDSAIEEMQKALEIYGNSKHWDYFHVCDSYSGEIGSVFNGYFSNDNSKDWLRPCEIANEALVEVKKIMGEG